MLYFPETEIPKELDDDMDNNMFTVGDMSLAAYGYWRGFPLLGITKETSGYTRFHFRSDDARQMAMEYRNPQTEVRLQAYLAALKYLQTLRADIRPGTTEWAEEGSSL
jgi:hypothetical protein